jgi:hypothetical protein
MKKLRRVTEPEVIAEFLKSEFYHEEFHHDREQFEHLVLDADISNEAENALRRALLFRRRGHLWRELPADTQWWHVHIEACDVERIRVFPRAHWRKIADGSFDLNDIVARIRSRQFSGRTGQFVRNIESLSARLRWEHDNSSILLIARDESHPVTILEGNHRLTASLLASSDILQTSFRVLCGFSPRMNQSCWYETNLANLLRYAAHRIRNIYDREADIERLLQQVEPERAKSYPAVAAPKAIANPK